MKTTRFVLIALLAGASLMAPIASQAETIFERFAPPLLLPIPIPVPVPGHIRGPEIRVQTAPVWHDDYDRDYRYERRHDRRDYRYDRYDDRHDRRYDRRYDRHDRRYDRRDRHDYYRR